MSTSRRIYLLCLASLLAGGCIKDDQPVGDLAAAWQEARYLNFKKSHRMFEGLRRDAPPNSEAWIECTLGLAISLHHTQPDVRADKERAGKLYDELIGACTSPTILPQVLLLRARLADQVDYTGDRPDLDAARSLYARLQTEFPRSRQANEAVLYLGHAAAMSGNASEASTAVEEIKEWIDTHPNNPLASLQWDLVGRLYMYPLDDPAAAVEAFLKAEATGLPPMTQMDAFFWRIANLAERGKDPKTAIKYFRRIILEEPRSGYGYESQLRLKALGETPPPLTDPFDFMTDGHEGVAL
jgi:tetratricopeptide (TPR) repeat protein